MNDPADRTGKLEAPGGSASDAFYNVLANAALSTLWLKNSGPEEKELRISAMAAGRSEGARRAGVA